MATRKSKCSQTSDLNLQEGAIFSRSLNDNRRRIMTGLYFISFSSQNVCFNNVYSLKKYKPEPNRNLEKTNRNRTVSSEPIFRLTVAALVFSLNSKALNVCVVVINIL